MDELIKELEGTKLELIELVANDDTNVLDVELHGSIIELEEKIIDESSEEEEHGGIRLKLDGGKRLELEDPMIELVQAIIELEDEHELIGLELDKLLIMSKDEVELEKVKLQVKLDDELLIRLQGDLSEENESKFDEQLIELEDENKGENDERLLELVEEYEDKAKLDEVLHWLE